MRSYFGYIRVSTARQGELGVSLQQQRDAIAAYAHRFGLPISQWFEERDTAAKRGRPVFADMLRQLRRNNAAGVIIHKIDRSARNLRDWADLGDLIDAGVQVHFANEALDLHSRGGRLSADIQAVIAADYVRNLREEIKKGFYGRIKQGILPLPAPLGYRDCGAGKPKEPDPAAGPLVRQMFELYAGGGHTLHTLRDEIHRRGLRNRRGGALSVNGISGVLNNPFYVGLIRLRRTGETFPGAHQPLISTEVFERVRAMLRGRVAPRGFKHAFLFRRMFTCKACGYRLIGEKRKGHVYYRCHSRGCTGTSFREDRLDAMVRARLSEIAIPELLHAELRKQLDALRGNWEREREARRQALTLQSDALSARLQRLTDAYLDAVIDRAAFEERKAALLMERQRVQERRDGHTEGLSTPDRVEHFLGLAERASFLYETDSDDGKREMLKSLTSDRVIAGKDVELTWVEPLATLADWLRNTNGGAYRETGRTIKQELGPLLTTLVRHASHQPSAPHTDQDNESGENNEKAKHAA
jgi:DNA invertase Pin-like site-specific DNA recombinase